MKRNASIVVVSIFLLLAVLFPLSASALVINEVMYDSTLPDDEDGEWIEVYVDVAPGNINGYVVKDNDGRTIPVPGDLSPAAGEYILFVTGGDPINNNLTTSPYVIYRGYGSAIWADAGDDVSIANTGGYCVDYMTYGVGGDDPCEGFLPCDCSWDDTGGNPVSSAAGTSLSLIVNGDDNDAAADWAESGTAGTIGPHSQSYANDGPTAVELERFEAIPGSLSILIEWETASEIDSEGFHLWRSAAAEGTYEPITADLIAAQGGPLWGATYTYEDLDVEMGRTYWYKLEDVDIYGQSAFHGPIEAAAQAACGVVDGPTDGFGALWLLVLAIPAVLVVAGRKKLAKKRKATGDRKEKATAYEPPKILTYSGEELLEELGPAQACRGFTCPVSPTP